MKTKHTFGALLLLSMVLPSLGTAQIRDNDASANVLAVQCSVSSGYASENYEEYSRKLAKTIGMLDMVQQKRVFGYVPQPIGNSGDFGRGDLPGEDTGGGENEGTDTNSGVGNDSGEPLLNPGDSGGGLPSDQDGGDTTTSGNDPEQEEEPDPQSSGSDWWDNFLGWFGDLLDRLEEEANKK